MTTFFVADLHLSGERLQTIELFQQFLLEQSPHAEVLYILGDLFEAWLGDDAVLPDMVPVVNALKTFTDSGVPVFVMHGNRDFLLSEQFEKLTGCTLLAEPAIIDLYGTPTLLLHGDTLCTDDVAYQKLRAVVRSPEWKAGVLKKPIEERIEMASQARAQSQAHTREKSEKIMDVNAQAVEAAFREHRVERLIHGHTHRPTVHELTIDGHPVTRIVLGDWSDQTSVLRVDEKGLDSEGL
ncbi:MAG: UDP-2,3-diacylglucosamine diphosphatase [Gammaproteobacteria bacterium]|nr:UDP-2,3-diacylglucosamine diphosphatase [Gammaproteobacteria bacterium]